jgi:hypothetical protein
MSVVGVGAIRRMRIDAFDRHWQVQPECGSASQRQMLKPSATTRIRHIIFGRLEVRMTSRRLVTGEQYRGLVALAADAG